MFLVDPEVQAGSIELILVVDLWGVLCVLPADIFFFLGVVFRS
jgi:hypothetical protein